MDNRVKKGFYIFYVFCIVIIVGENIWFWNSEIIRYNLLALFTLILIFVYNGEGPPSKKDGIVFYITFAVIFVLYIILLYIIGNYFRSQKI